jgi:hypothetical protein
MMTVKEGDNLRGVMTQKPSGEWVITSTVLNSGAVSTYTANVKQELKYAVVTLEIIRAYSCGAYPAGSGTSFTDNILTVHNQPSVPAWSTTISHSECGQSLDYSEGGAKATASDVNIHYSSGFAPKYDDMYELYSEFEDDMGDSW